MHAPKHKRHSSKCAENVSPVKDHLEISGTEFPAENRRKSAWSYQIICKTKIVVSTVTTKLEFRTTKSARNSPHQSLPQKHVRCAKQRLSLPLSILSRYEEDERFTAYREQTHIGGMYFVFLLMVEDTSLLAATEVEEKNDWLLGFIFLLRSCDKGVFKAWMSVETKRRQMLKKKKKT